MNLIAQVLGVLGMGTSIVSFQARTARRIIFFQLVASVLFVIHFFLLGGIMGALLNIADAARCFVFYKWKKPHRMVVPLFLLVYLLSYLLTFTVFAKEPTAANLLLEAAPIVAMSATTFGYHSGKERTIRLCGYISSPMWLTYNIFTGSIGGALTECFSLCSITVSLIRFREKHETT